MPDVLYIHPLGHLNELPIPAGAISAMNALTTPVIGRYAFEVKDEEIARARIIAVDLHWAIALSGFASLVAHVRRLRPDVPIIVGGITAGLLAPALLARFPIDFVLVGDSEVAFRALVHALIAGESTEGIPNVATRGEPLPARRRMSAAEFDATDCLTGDWFPTWARMSDWHSAAFSPARTIPVARGCALRCAACFGSHAELYGSGVLLRTPARVASELRRALDMGIEALRLILGKVPAVYLATLAATLAEHGPFPFRQTVGFFLCTPPDSVALEQLAIAFPRGLALSFVPPGEHEPPPPKLAAEMDTWRGVVQRLADFPWVHLDTWATKTSDVERLKHELGIDEDTGNATVSLGAVWNVTRPGAPATQAAELDALLDLSQAIWTFYAARLLSPPAARVLAPYRFLDELPGDPRAAAPPDDDLGELHDAALAQFERHALPLFPGLTVHAVPVARRSETTLARQHEGVYFEGAMGYTTAFEPTGAPPTPLPLSRRHDGLRFESRLVVPPEAHAVGFLCAVPEDPRSLSEWPARGRRHGVVVLALPKGARGALTLRLTLRVQEVQAALSNEDGRLVARGRAHMGYLRPPHARRR